MKIVIIGGSGLIGTKLGKKLRERGQEVVSASPASGVNTLTGEGLAKALEGAEVVVDVSNSPSFEDAAVMKFFQTSAGNLAAAELAAGVKHHVALSIVGADRMTNVGYMRAKVAQEKLIKESKVPYTILRATQFYEFAGQIADAAANGDTVRLPPALMQPIAADDVVAALAEVAVSAPINGITEVAGPEQIRQDELARRFFSARQDKRKVVTDAHATYYGGEVNDQSLVPGGKARIGTIRFADWLGQSPAQK